MKLHTQLLVAACAALFASSFVSCTVSSVDRYGHDGGYGGGYREGPPSPRVRQAYARLDREDYEVSGVRMPPRQFEDGPQMQQPHGALRVIPRGRSHFNGKLSGNQVFWTKNKVPISASQVPTAAKRGLEEDLRRRGIINGPIEHVEEVEQRERLDSPDSSESSHRYPAPRPTRTQTPADQTPEAPFSADHRADLVSSPSGPTPSLLPQMMPELPVHEEPAR